MTGTFTCESTYRGPSLASVSPNKEQRIARPLKFSGVVTRNVNRKAHRTSPEKSRLNRDCNLALDRAGRNTRQVRRNFIFQRVIRLFARDNYPLLSSRRGSTQDTDGSPTSCSPFTYFFPARFFPSPCLLYYDALRSIKEAPPDPDI